MAGRRVEPGLRRLRLGDLDVDLVDLPSTVILSFKARLLAEWTDKACDAWIVTRPCWAHAAEPIRRICRMWAFLPEEGRDGRADDQDQLFVELRLRGWCRRVRGPRRPRRPSAAAAASCAGGGAASGSRRRRGRLEGGDPLAQPAQLLPQALQGLEPPAVRSTVSDFMRAPRSQRDQAVLLRRPVIALGLEVFQRLRQVLARVGRLDDVVDQPAAGGDVGGGERVERYCSISSARWAALSSAASISLRKTISTAPSAPMTATSAVGQAKTRSAPRSFEHIARCAPP